MAIPGTRCKHLTLRSQAVVPQRFRHAPPIFVIRAADCILGDVDGNACLDCAGGLGAWPPSRLCAAIHPTAAHQVLDSVYPHLA